MEAFPLRAVAHEERLTVVQHLSELRARLLLSVAVLAVLFAGCLSQSRSLLHVRLELTTMLALGAMFEIPVLLLALGRVRILSSATLRRHRRYALVGITVLGALLPGTDPVTTVLETLPLFALYEATIVLLRLTERRHDTQVRHA